MGDDVISAVFDDRAEARRAVQELRSAGVDESAISIVGRPDDDDTHYADEHHDGAGKGSVAGSTAAGGVGGALLGIGAMAIPGVGPLAAAGAIARMLSDHDVDRDEAQYYEEHIERGGTFVSVDTRRADADRDDVRAILRSCGGHSASSPRST